MNEIEVMQEPSLPAAFAAVTPWSLIDKAIDRGRPIEEIRELIAMAERMEDRQARKRFDEAVSQAKGELSPIIKTEVVDFANKSAAGRTNYKYESFAAIAKIVDPILGRHGLSYRFRTAQDGKTVTITCILSGFGHREENSLSGPNDESGNKNAIQGVGSACTFLERYTLKAALGLAASDDDDGGGGKRDEPEYITPNQVNYIQDLIERTGGDLPKFLAWAKIEQVADIPADKYDEAIAKINKAAANRAKQKTEGARS